MSCVGNDVGITSTALKKTSARVRSGAGLGRSMMLGMKQTRRFTKNKHGVSPWVACVLQEPVSFYGVNTDFINMDGT